MGNHFQTSSRNSLFAAVFANPDNIWQDHTDESS
jgi:hypothetical protein